MWKCTETVFGNCKMPLMENIYIYYTRCHSKTTFLNAALLTQQHLMMFMSHNNSLHLRNIFPSDVPHSAGSISSCGVCVERATHPLQNNDGFGLHLPVLLLSASSAELQLVQCQPGRQWRALPEWYGEDDQVEDIPGLPAELPSYVQLHPLSGTSGEPRRADFKGEGMMHPQKIN